MAMADRPIIFSAPMVRALLSGRKTQTRRVLRDPTGSGWYRHPKTSQIVGCMGNPPPLLPYAPGDRLWVREALERANGEAIGYPADGDWLPNTPWRWQRRTLPSIHMPRWASRLTLTVTEVRVQRLQDISEEDARAEGAKRPMAICEDDGTTYVDGFANIWTSLHGPDAWDANPWVAAISFGVQRGNIDQIKPGE